MFSAFYFEKWDVLSLNFAPIAKQEMNNTNIKLITNDNEIIGANIFNAKSLFNNIILVNGKIFLDHFKIIKTLKEIDNLFSLIKFDSEYQVVKIIDFNLIPNSNSLYHVKVFNNKEQFEVVTNAKNIFKEMITVVINPNAIDINGNQIVPIKLANQLSSYMFCNQNNLGLTYFNNEGIIDLTKWNVPLGSNLIDLNNFIKNKNGKIRLWV